MRLILVIGALGIIRGIIGASTEFLRIKEGEEGFCLPGHTIKKICNDCHCSEDGRFLTCTNKVCYDKEFLEILNNSRKKRGTDDTYKDFIEPSPRGIPFNQQQELQRQRYLQQQQDFYDNLQLQQDLAKQQAELAQQQAELAQQQALINQQTSEMQSQLDYQREQDLQQWEEDMKQQEFDEQQFELEQQQFELEQEQYYNQQQKQMQDEQYFKKMKNYPKQSKY